MEVGRTRSPVRKRRTSVRRKPEARDTASTELASIEGLDGHAKDGSDDEDLVEAAVGSEKKASTRIKQFVDDPTAAADELMRDYTDIGIDLDNDKYRVLLLSYYMEVRTNLTTSLGRKPTVDEWAYSLNMAANDLKADIVKSQTVRARIVQKNMDLVRSTARVYRGRGLAYQDLVQEGCFGLIKAAEMFDPSRGFLFKTYAKHWVKQRISRALQEHSRMIRLPRRVHDKVIAMARMSNEIGREPTLQELEAHTSLPADKIVQYKHISKPVRSFEEYRESLSREDRRETLESRIADDTTQAPEAFTQQHRTKSDLHETLARLPELERDVISLRFGLTDGLPKTYEEVVSELSHDEVKCKHSAARAERRAFLKLRKPNMHRKLKMTYMDYGDDYCPIYPTGD